MSSRRNEDEPEREKARRRSRSRSHDRGRGRHGGNQEEGHARRKRSRSWDRERRDDHRDEGRSRRPESPRNDVSPPAGSGRPKIFFLGFHKCGTTSFHAFMEAHGYDCVHDTWQACQQLGLGKNSWSFDGGRFAGDGRRQDIAATIEQLYLRQFRSFVGAHEVFSDNPWPLLYQLADRYFPGSKFILATRDTEDWLRSQVKFFKNQETKLRMMIYGYGCVVGHEDRYREVYEEHNRKVLAYFGPERLGRDLLVFHLGKDEDSEVTQRLHDFLGLDKSRGIIFGRHNVTEPDDGSGGGGGKKKRETGGEHSEGGVANGGDSSSHEAGSSKIAAEAASM